MERMQRKKITQAITMPEISVLESLFDLSKNNASLVCDGTVELGFCGEDVDVAERDESSVVCVKTSVD
jgi:hypothetical protein